MNATAPADALTVDETFLNANTSANFADNFSSTFNFGADGAGTLGRPTASISALRGRTPGLSMWQRVRRCSCRSTVAWSRAHGGAERSGVHGDGGRDGACDARSDPGCEPSDTANPDDAVTLSAANLISLTRTDTITDRDGDRATGQATINIGQALSFKDDGLARIFPDHAVLANAAAGGPVQSLTMELDFDTNVDPNFGADGGTVKFAASLTGTDSGLKSGGATILYSVDATGTILTGYTNNVADPVFKITLLPDGSFATANDQYKVEVFKPVDGGAEVIALVPGAGDFKGGNDPWAGFFDGIVDNNNESQDVLLTPIPQDTVNTTANNAGISGGASIGAGEAIRIDYVVDLRGGIPMPSSNPSGTYATAANQDHVFDRHRDVDGAGVLIRGISAAGASSVRLKTFDDPDGNSAVGDGAVDQITKVTISYNGETKSVTFGTDVLNFDTAFNITVGGNVFTVTFDDIAGGAVEALIGNVKNNTRLGATTGDFYDSLEVHHAGGDTFQIGEFFQTAVPAGPGDQLLRSDRSDRRRWRHADEPDRRDAGPDGVADAELRRQCRRGLRGDGRYQRQHPRFGLHRHHYGQRAQQRAVRQRRRRCS